jgi:chaperone modulatory protein CbpM
MTKTPTPSVDAETMGSEGCTLEELCLCCKADADWVISIVDYGIIEPMGAERSQWRFTSMSVVRAVKAKRLERDLKINIPGIAVVLDLLEEIERLRSPGVGSGPDVIE